MSHEDSPLRGQHVLILTGDIYEDLELWYPKLRLMEAGATVTVDIGDREYGVRDFGIADCNGLQVVVGHYID